MIACLQMEDECKILPYRERRVSCRQRCEATIICTHFDLQCSARADNISQAGLCFHTEFAMEKGLFLHVRIDDLSVTDYLPTTDEFSWPTSAGAQVRWCRKVPDGDEYQIGLKFLIPS